MIKILVKYLFGLSGVNPAKELAIKLEDEIVGFFDNHLNHESKI